MFRIQLVQFHSIVFILNIDLKLRGVLFWIVSNIYSNHNFLAIFSA
jgi:hypothetical protein